MFVALALITPTLGAECLDAINLNRLSWAALAANDSRRSAELLLAQQGKQAEAEGPASPR